MLMRNLYFLSFKIFVFKQIDSNCQNESISFRLFDDRIKNLIVKTSELFDNNLTFQIPVEFKLIDDD